MFKFHGNFIKIYVQLVYTKSVQSVQKTETKYVQFIQKTATKFVQKSQKLHKKNMFNLFTQNLFNLLKKKSTISVQIS